jgi:16S rRNA (cytosine1402-N4)-methyltransferase
MSAKIMHESVLLHEAVTALNINAVGVYVDGTFGRGGHSKAILNLLGDAGELIAFDKDLSAIEYASQQFTTEKRLKLHHASFAQMKSIIQSSGWMGKVDGILLDLGVSSPQLDEADRGFSFLRDGPLDMRMNQQLGETAAQWIAVASYEDIKHVLRVYGEEKFASLIAKRIVERREEKAFKRTHDLADFIRDVIPNKAQEKGKHPATRSFQAIRIYINRELEDLEALLNDVTDILKVGGRLVVISFHSLEDRIVKHYIRNEERGPQIPRHIPITVMHRDPHMRSVTKPIKSSPDEVQANVRSRSAIMRVAEKVAA